MNKLATGVSGNAQSVDQSSSGNFDATACDAFGGAVAPDPRLVEQVKAICRSDPTAKALWCRWCDQNTEGTKDPNRMDTDSLKSFFDAYDAGQIQLLDASLADRTFAVGTKVDVARMSRSMPEQAELAEVVKIGQRVSPSWKIAWNSFCEARGNGTLDPLKHSRNYLVEFIELLGAQGMSNSGADGAAAVLWPGLSLNPGPSKLLATTPATPSTSKRLRTEQQTSSLTSVSTANPVAVLALRVKELQKTDELAKQLWSEYCDENHSGVKDPARHDEISLRHFLQVLGLPQPDFIATL